MFPMILPKGIVVNSSDIYAEVASYPTVPPEKIWEYWHVYTTTFRKLIDPTAHRLENFWWHVWGSDRRLLSGAVLAKIFEDISKGPTVVDLVGLPNRLGGPVECRYPPPTQAAPESSQGTTVSLDREEEKKEDGVLQANPPLKPLSSSSSKPPPPHPILKKTRGPSSSGPRPTARFISPHESAEEDNDEAIRSELFVGAKTSDGAATKAIGMQQPRESPSTPKPEKKKSTPTGTKKYIAAKPTTKRRPYVARRTGSQSSAGSAEGTTIKSGSSGSGGPKYLGSQRSITPIAEKAVGATTGGEHATASESSTVASPIEHLSAKATGKRPIVPRFALEQEPDPQPRPRPSSQQISPVLQYHRPMAVIHRGGNMRGAQPSSLDLKRQTHPPGFEAVIARNQSERDLSRRGFEPLQPPLGAAPMVRSRSDMESRGQGSGMTGRHPVRGLISATTATTSSVAAQGTFEFDQPSIPQHSESKYPDEEEVSYLEPRKPPSILDSRLTPTAPNPKPDVPLGRTKSQLTLLLEREKSRLGES